ncbi:zinc-ribbon domain-containing protein [Dietzia sp. 179-F 9C3 NHS]|uniref:zinc-ribbon domain-containing protein n=1 Tax=Dietzia sp. 179-F 9C3 NHS TaxID=3374295 RepID=UPI003879E640
MRTAPGSGGATRSLGDVVDLGVAAHALDRVLAGGAHAAQRVDRNKRAFSVFFIPLVPLGSSYSATCTACAATMRLTRGQADQILHGAA